MMKCLCLPVMSDKMHNSRYLFFTECSSEGGVKYAGIKGTDVRIGWLLLASLSERIDRSARK